MTDRPAPADRQRLFAVTAVVLALLVVTAGCSGLPGVQGPGTEGEEEDENAEPAETQGETPTETSANTEANGEANAETEPADPATETSAGATGTPTPTPTSTPAGTVVTGDFGDYEFSSGETYVYSIGLSGSDRRVDGRWEVLEVSGDQLTVETNVTLPGFPSRTWEGTKEEIYREIGESDELAGSLFLSLHGGTMVAAGHSLTEGNTWTVTPEDFPSGMNISFETAQVEVTGTDSYADIQCTNLLVTPDSEDMEPATYCVNPDYPFPLATTSEESDATDIVLSEAER